MTHMGRKHKESFKCSICDASFFGRASLKFHIGTVHEGKKPIKCSICDASFTQSGSLKRHIETLHEGQKPLNCSKKRKQESINNLILLDVPLSEAEEVKIEPGSNLCLPDIQVLGPEKNPVKIDDNEMGLENLNQMPQCLGQITNVMSRIQDDEFKSENSEPGIINSKVLRDTYKKQGKLLGRPKSFTEEDEMKLIAKHKSLLKENRRQTKDDLQEMAMKLNKKTKQINKFLDNLRYGKSKRTNLPALDNDEDLTERSLEPEKVKKKMGRPKLFTGEDEVKLIAKLEIVGE